VKHAFLIAIATALLSGGVLWAQEGEGTVNSLSVNPRQNAVMTNTTGTESGQPTADVPGSQNQPNGLVPVTSYTSVYGNSSNKVPTAAPGKAATATAASKPAAQNEQARKRPAGKSTAPRTTTSTAQK